MSKDQMDVILEDLKTLFKKDEILGKDFDNFLKRIKSDTVRNYLLSLKNHSQPEQALKDAFFSINSIFAKYLFKKLHPEVGGESGFVDYLIKDEREEIKLEIKPLFEAEFEKGKSGEIFKRIKKVKLNWEKHKDQIRKYLGRRGEFVVFTNLEEWYFFSRNFSLDENCYYFANVNLFDLIKDFQQIGDFWEYLDRQEELSVKEPLDKKFFNSLRTWVEELGKVKFKVDEKKKTELIIKLINKFIFIQTLDNFWVIKGKYLEEKWVNIEREWQAKNKLRILRKFLSEINEYFYELYDTELFRDGENRKTILDYIEKTDENIELFYNKLKLVLGIDYGTTAIGWERGIIQYNFRRIDEDILGKAYETFLAEVRKEQGIYYTPKYITQYIVENTVGKIYDELLEKIKKNLEEKNFDECKELIKKFISIKVLDPACGSGSFLIKALRLIWNKYNELNKILENEKRKYMGNDLLSQMQSKELKEINELHRILNYKDNKDKISKIIIRHIHGNDLDANALEVAKVNLWLEAIKLAPSEFRYDRLPADTNHILPDLEMNLGNGDSLVGLPEDLTIEILKERHEDELKKLFELRKEYLDDPTKEEAIKEINEIKKKLRKELDEEFKKYLEENNLPLEILEKTKPFHWALDFWFVFFEENLEAKEKDKQGFDAVIGNPPYVKSERLDDLIKKFHQKIFFTARGFYNLYSVFSERSLQLLDGEGIFCFIVQNSFLLGNDYKPTRLFLSQKNISMIVDLGYGVFEDVGVSTLLLFVNGNKRPTLHLKTKWCPLINKQECLYKAPYLTYSKQEFISDFDCLFAIHFKNYKEREILKKIYSIPTKFSDFVLIKRGIEKKTDLRFIEEKKIRVNKNNKNIRKVLLGKESIERYLIKNFKYFFYEPQKRETVYKGEKIFTLPKIIVPENSEKICGVYDEDQFFTTRSLYCCVQKGKQPKVNLRYLLGILNSKILEFYVNKIIKGGEVHNQIRIEDYKHLPIRCSTNKKDPIINLVQKIITLKKLQHKFRELWRYYSRKFRNNYKSLGEILLDDKRAIQEGNFDKVWISEASVYPDEQNELLEKEFKKFRIVGEGDNKLKIYGIEGQREELLLETKANKKEFRDIIYLELLELMDSRVKKKTLKDILSKSEISVIQPNIWEKSGNLLKITKEKFREWLEKENFEIKEDDIVKIDNEIQEIDNLIDAHVFKLYELTKEEVEIVLDSLNVVESIKNDILRKF